MVSVADFNIFIVVMFWSAITIFSLAIGLMVLLLAVRIRAINRRKHIRKVVAYWRDVFTGVTPSAPTKVRRSDAFTVLNLWNDFHQVRTDRSGVSDSRLESVALAHRFDQLAIRLLRGDVGSKLVALTTIGYLRLSEALPQIRLLTDDELGEVSLAAFRALVLIDSSQIGALVHALAVRDDWRPRAVEQLLRELGTKTISEPLARAIRGATDAQLVALLRYFTICDPSAVRGAVYEILESREDAGVSAAALRALTSFAQAQDRPLVRRFLKHPQFFVLVAAIGALAPICEVADRATLTGLLGHGNSWVRYRAAQLLLDCYTHENGASDLRRDIADRYARDALTQVLAERSVLASRPASRAPERPPADRRQIERRPMDGMRVGE